jgi:putative endonuclease
MKKIKTKQVGYHGEQEAKKYLENSGFKIIAGNFREAFGEIDIICENSEYIIFAEVKSRKKTKVSRLESVDFRKQKKIIKTALKYQTDFSFEKQPRFDVIEVIFVPCGKPILNHIENAFQLEGFNEII